MKSILSFFSAAFVGLFLFASSAQADVLGITGVDAGDDSAYAYVGAIVPLNGDLSKDGYLIRAWGYAQRFEYKRTNNPKVKASGGGGEIAIGRQWRGSKTNFTAYLGLVSRNLDTSPEDINSKADGHSSGVKLQLELTHKLTNKWEAVAMGSHTRGGGFRDSWLRLRAGYQWNDSLRVGPELAHVDGPDYNSGRVGLFVSGISLGSLKLDLSGGSEDNGGYFGISLSKVF